ncbi:MAG: hypothetical protein ACK4K5_09035, partial [Thermosynechococcus sp.]|uniref:hypothetical protein n=1 Tax=Thermosynechococcus sp. TaxID=2814275 RepID=UPI00391CBC95
MKLALHPLLALMVAVASQMFLVCEIALGQATNDCGNPSGAGFNSTAGTTDDNLICGSKNSIPSLASLQRAIAVGIENTIQNANSENSAVGIENRVDGVNSQNHAFGSGNKIGLNLNVPNPNTSQGNNNT